MGVNRRKSYARWSYLMSAPLVKKGFKRITADCVKIIRVLEEEGPLRHGELMKMTGISKGTIDRRLYHLRAIGAITLIGKKYQAGSEPQDERVLRAMKQLKGEGFHQQSLETIANMAGLTNEEAEKPARRLAPHLKVRVGDKDIKTDASVVK